MLVLDGLKFHMDLSRKDVSLPQLGIVPGLLQQKQLEGLRVNLGSQIECAAHHAREVIASTGL